MEPTNIEGERTGRILPGNLYMAFAALYCALYTAITAYFFLRPDAAELLSQTNLLTDLLFIVPISLALLCSAIAFLRSSKHKQTWLLVLISMLFWLAPEVLNLYLIDINQGFVDPIISSNINALYYGFFVFFPLAILVRVYMRLKTGLRRLNMLIDVGLVLSSMLGLFNVILELQNTGSLLNGWLIGAGYFLFALVVIFAIYFTWIKLHGAGLQVWEKYLVIALGFLVLANIFYFLRADVGLYRHGSVYEVGWLVGAFFIGAAALVDAMLLDSSVISDSMKLREKPLSRLQTKPVSPLIIGLMNLMTFYYVVITPAGEKTPMIAMFLASAALFVSVKFYLTMRENAFLRSNTYRDILTNVYSKNFFVEMLEHQYESAKRYESEIILLLIDIDNFKDVTGDKDYSFGEKILGKIATILGLMVRRADIICRVGGDEFAVLMPEAHFDQAQAIADRIRVAIAEEMASLMPGKGITVSIGVSHYPKLADEPRAIYHSAQAAVQKAKELGKDLTVIAEKTSRPSVS